MSYKPDIAVAYIVIHYSATPIESDVSSDDIDRMHRARGFNMIGYHWYIRKDGQLERGRDMTEAGRFEVGAHSKGENSVSIGVCFEGGVTQADTNAGFDSRTPAQIATMIDLIDKMLMRFPGAVVRGHRDMPGAATQCPGFDAGAWWDGVVAARNKPGRKSKAQSTTLAAAGTTAASLLAAAGAALGDLAPWLQGVVVAAVLVGLVGLGWIARERIRRWGEGDR